MSETKDSADLERVLRDIAKGSGTPMPKPRERVLAAVSLRILTDPPVSVPVKSTDRADRISRIGELWRYRGEEGQGSRFNSTGERAADLDRVPLHAL